MKFIVLFFTSFLLSIILTQVFRNIGVAYNLYDHPNKNEFKIHQKPVPFLGGIGIFLAFTLSSVLFIFFYDLFLREVKLMVILIGAVLFLFLGLWDDMKWKKTVLSHAKIKFFVQIIIGIFIIFSFILVDIKINFIPIFLFEVILMGCYFLGIVNAINLMDGLDGLAAGLVIISLVGFVVLSFLDQNILCLILSFALLGSVSGFLIFNWHPASIFMGDNGSYFLGFIVASLAISFTYKLYNFGYFIGPILIIGIPVFETAYTVARRVFIRKSIFLGDRSHLYDQVYKKNNSMKYTVAIFYVLQALIVSLGVIIYLLSRV